MKIRFLPSILVIFVALLTLKMLVIFEEGKDIFDVSFARTTHAKEEPKKDEPAKEESHEEKPKEEGEHKEEEPAKEGEHGEAAAEGEEGGHGGGHGGGEGEEKKEKKNERIRKLPKMAEEVPKPEYSPSEVSILQNLSKRREELDKWDQDIENKEKVLQATEVKVEQKVEELKALQADVEKLLAQYNEKEEEKIKSLVKIYENMKPKDAAKIFEELDMNVLLPVVDKMKESKVAIILGLMDPTKAKDLTIKFAKQKKLPDVNPNIEG